MNLILLKYMRSLQDFKDVKKIYLVNSKVIQKLLI